MCSILFHFNECPLICFQVYLIAIMYVCSQSNVTLGVNEMYSKQFIFSQQQQQQQQRQIVLFDVIVATTTTTIEQQLLSIENKILSFEK